MSTEPTDSRSNSPSSRAPRWTRSLLGRLAARERADEVIGDLEEVHRARIGRHGRVLAAVLTSFETVDMAVALLHERKDMRRDTTRLARRATCTDAMRSIPTVSWLDFKLGLRMLARYPSLTVVAVLAMAFGIAIGAGGFQFVKEQVLLPLPYSEAAQIIRIQNVNTATTRADPRMLHDFASWQEELRSVERLSALYLRERNLVAGEGTAAPVAEAAVSATAFGLIHVAPLLGRELVPADEASGAPAVAVIGYDLWQTRFAGSRDVVGSLVRLGGEQTTVVGVMPREFSFFVPGEGFTIREPQELWVPFRLRALDFARGEGPGIVVFGRLARDATQEAAQAELTTIAARGAAASLNTSGQVKPTILTFDRSFGNTGASISSPMITLSALFLASLMVVVCGNVALLIFARAATRERELAVRSALGASRGRIVSQLFAEALVLAGVAVLVGLVGASAGLRWAIHVVRSMIQAQGLVLPSWIGDTLSPSTIGYAMSLALVGAVVAGVLPGLKVTGRWSRVGLQRLPGGGSGAPMSGVWTGIIVTQVALTVMFVPIAVMLGLQTWKVRTVDHNLPTDAYLSVRLEMDDEAGSHVPSRAPGARVDGASLARFERSYRSLERRLAAEPGVTGVTVADKLPGSWHERRRFEVDAPSDVARPEWENRAQVAHVDPGFFEMMRTPILAGRRFRAADVAVDQRVVIVNESFVREFLDGRNAVGQRVRGSALAGGDEEEPWYTIVGVVRDLAMTIDPTLPNNAGIYHPLLPGDAYPTWMAVRVDGEAGAFTGRLRELAMETDPSLRVDRALPMDQAAQGMLIAYDAWFRVIVLVCAMAMLLTNAGIYAVVSFTVARRTREIGVRVALGAERRQVVAAILSRTARHVAVGVLIGAGLGSLFMFALSEGSFRPTALEGGVLLAVYMGLMMGVCLLACVVPMRRALEIEPTSALAADG